MEPYPEIDLDAPGYGDFHDELPLWSAPFGLLLLEEVPIAGGLTILDVGAGTGFLTLELAQRCGPTTTVIAVDPWAEGMRRLRRRLDRLGLDNVRLIEGDAAELDLPAQSVDLVVSNLGINNFSDPDAVLATCHRLLKPGGALLLTTNLVGHMEELYAVYRSTLEELDSLDAVDRAARLAALEAHVAHRGTVDSVTARLSAAGFELASVSTDSFHFRFADGSALLRHHLIRLGFLPAWKEIAAGDAQEAIFAAFEQGLDRLAAERGELSLTVPVACFEARRP